MSRGEEQKPVTDAYRTNWETIFGQKGGPASCCNTGRRYERDTGGCAMDHPGECDLDPGDGGMGGWPSAKKAPPVKTEPCKECRGEGKVGFEDPQHGHAMSNRCRVCGGEGVIPVED